MTISTSLVSLIIGGTACYLQDHRLELASSAFNAVATPGSSSNYHGAYLEPPVSGPSSFYGQYLPDDSSSNDYGAGQLSDFLRHFPHESSPSGANLGLLSYYDAQLDDNDTSIPQSSFYAYS